MKKPLSLLLALLTVSTLAPLSHSADVPPPLTPLLLSPPAPKLDHVYRNKTHAELSWTWLGSIQQIDAFEVNCSLNGTNVFAKTIGLHKTKVAPGPLPGHTTFEWMAHGLDPNLTYCFDVRVFEDGGASLSSNSLLCSP